MTPLERLRYEAERGRIEADAHRLQSHAEGRCELYCHDCFKAGMRWVCDGCVRPGETVHRTTTRQQSCRRCMGKADQWSRPQVQHLNQIHDPQEAAVYAQDLAGYICDDCAADGDVAGARAVALFPRTCDTCGKYKEPAELRVRTDTEAK